MEYTAYLLLSLVWIAGILVVHRHLSPPDSLILLLMVMGVLSSVILIPVGDPSIESIFNA